MSMNRFNGVTLLFPPFFPGITYLQAMFDTIRQSGGQETWFPGLRWARQPRSGRGSGPLCPSVPPSLPQHPRGPEQGLGLPRATCHLLLHPLKSCQGCREAALASGACCQLFSLATGLPTAASGGGRAAAWVWAAGSSPGVTLRGAGSRRATRRGRCRRGPGGPHIGPGARSPRTHRAGAPRQPGRPPAAAVHSPPHSAEYWSPQSPDCGLQPPPAGASCCCRCCSSCLSRDSGE